MATDVKIDHSGKVIFYTTIDGKFIINIDDISFMIFRPIVVDNKISPNKSYFEVYMKGNHNGLKIAYRDGVQIKNIMMSDFYGLFKAGYSIKSKENEFSIPNEAEAIYSSILNLRMTNRNYNETLDKGNWSNLNLSGSTEESELAKAPEEGD